MPWLSLVVAASGLEAEESHPCLFFKDIKETTGHRRLLSEGQDAWKRYLPVIAETGREHYVMLEFVRDDSPEVFLNDAETLKSWL